MPRIEMPKPIPEQAYEALIRQLRKFQKGLSEEMELGIVVGGAGGLIHVDSVRFGGHVIAFCGVDAEGREARLIQHYSQLNVLMVAVPKLALQPRRIGFEVSSGEGQS